MAVKIKTEKAVQIKIEGEVLANPKKLKGRQAAWRGMAGGCAKVCPTETDGPLWDLDRSGA